MGSYLSDYQTKSKNIRKQLFEGKRLQEKEERETDSLEKDEANFDKTKDKLLDSIEKRRTLIENRAEVASFLLTIPDQNSVAVMLTTQDTHNEKLADEFLRWLPDLDEFIGKKDDNFKNAYQTALKKHIKKHTICRRMEVHDVSAPVLIHIIQRNIEAGQRKLLKLDETELLPRIGKRFRESWRIRVVIDDFNTLGNTFPEVREDPLLIPFILFYLGREGVTSLVIDTQTGKPDAAALSERFESALRAQVQNRLYTWRFPFYGENRVAITAIPPLSPDHRGAIRELRWEATDDSFGKTQPTIEEKRDDPLAVDPRFELYSGIEDGKPQPVPLEVRLYSETKSIGEYIELENQLFSELFTPVENVACDKTPAIIKPTSKNDYLILKDLCFLQRDTRLDYTLVLEVDEFWLLKRPSQQRAGSFRQREYYLATPVTIKNGEQELISDPYNLFQAKLPDNQAKQTDNNDTKDIQKLQHFADRELGYNLEKCINEKKKTGQPREHFIDRVPFAWDFGFMLCKESAWHEAIEKSSEKSMINEVWKNLIKAESSSNSEQKEVKTVRWVDFFCACQKVAEYQSFKTSTPIPAFDFSMISPESLSSLMLEIWASEIYDRLKKKGKQDSFAKYLYTREWKPIKGNEKPSLLNWLKPDEDNSLDLNLEGYSLELYKAWLLLVEVLDFSSLINNPSTFNFDFKD